MEVKPFQLAVRAAVVDDQGRYLLLRRSDRNRSFAGTWEWPGGKAEEGEVIDEAVRREVKEETGLDIRLAGVAGAYDIETPQQRLAVLCFEAQKTDGAFRLSEEHDEFAWVPSSGLLKLELTPGFDRFVEDYVQRLTSTDSKRRFVK